MNEQQKAAAADILTKLVGIAALMGSVDNNDSVPGFIVNETGRSFTESLANLAEIIGGPEFRNNILLDSMNEITAMQAMMEELGNLL